MVRAPVRLANSNARPAGLKLIGLDSHLVLDGLGVGLVSAPDRCPPRVGGNASALSAGRCGQHMKARQPARAVVVVTVISPLHRTDVVDAGPARR